MMRSRKIGWNPVGLKPVQAGPSWSLTVTFLGASLRRNHYWDRRIEERILNTMNARKAEPSSKPYGSEPSHSILLSSGDRKLNILDHNFQVAPRGMTFTTDSYFAPFTALSFR